jgi:hypothetical protein
MCHHLGCGFPFQGRARAALRSGSAVTKRIACHLHIVVADIDEGEDGLSVEAEPPCQVAIGLIRTAERITINRVGDHRDFLAWDAARGQSSRKP